MEEIKLKLTQRNMPTLVTALTLTDVTGYVRIIGVNSK